MRALNHIIAAVDDADARAALYYVGRYIKQASHFQEYGKDIFDDERRSAPTPKVKTLARAIIAAIEEREGTVAQNFELNRMLTIMREVSALEDGLGPEITEEDAERAKRFLAEFNLSRIKH